MTPLTVPEITRLLTTQPARPGLAEHWANWRRCHQARARWYHHRTRLAGDTTIPWSASEWVRQERRTAARSRIAGNGRCDAM